MTENMNAVTDRGATLQGKESLYAFQQRISERIKTAQLQSTQSQLHLHLLIGTRQVLVPLQDTLEILSLPVLTPLLLAKRWVLGLCVLRAEILTVLDMGHFLPTTEKVTQTTQANSPVAQTKKHLIVIAPNIAQQLSFVADALLGMVDLKSGQEAWVELEREHNGATSSVVLSSWRQQRSDTVSDVLSLKDILKSPEFLMIAHPR